MAAAPYRLEVRRGSDTPTCGRPRPIARRPRQSARRRSDGQGRSRSQAHLCRWPYQQSARSAFVTRPHESAHGRRSPLGTRSRERRVAWLRSRVEGCGDTLAGGTRCGSRSCRVRVRCAAGQEFGANRCPRSIAGRRSRRTRPPQMVRPRPRRAAHANRFVDMGLAMVDLLVHRLMRLLKLGRREHARSAASLAPAPTLRPCA
jgi:hypothetical protein